MSEHFSLDEFASRGEPVPVELVPRVERMMQALEVIRAELGGKPVSVISGWRSKKHNTAVGGARKSRHMQGDAADIRVKDVPPSVVADTVCRLIAEGKIPKGGVGRYPSFTHYDHRGVNARWVG